MSEFRREAVFQAIISRLRSKAPLLHNMWAMLGRGAPRTTAELAAMLWYPDPVPPSRAGAAMRVGAFCAHLNKRIKAEGLVIKPGAVKGTYQLYDLATWEDDQARARAALVPEGDKPALIKRKPRAKETAKRAKAGAGRKAKKPAKKPAR